MKKHSYEEEVSLILRKPRKEDLPNQKTFLSLIGKPKNEYKSLDKKKMVKP